MSDADGEGERDVVERIGGRSAVARRLARAVDTATDEYARSRALREIADGLRRGQLRVRTCAWCGSISLGAEWHRTSTGELVDELSRNSAATHGICPTCFADFLPDVPYPDDAGTAEPELP